MFPTMTRASPRHTNSPSGSLTPRTHFSEFRAYVQSNLQIGTDCEGKPKKYIRYDVLVSFWTREKVASVLQTELGERANLIPRDLLTSHYLRVFSILVYISSRNLSFVDEIIGLYSAKVYDDRLPSEEPRERLSRDTWFSFDENQWAFCPIPLKLNGSLHQKLDPRTIFAAKQVEPTSIGRPASKGLGPLDARFKFLELEKNPTQGRGGGSQIIEMAVVKSYPSAALQAFDSETLFYARSEQSIRRPPEILRCLGFYSCDSKMEGQTHNIVLEYAGKGSLLEYFGNESHPRTVADKSEFWKSFLNFLCGLEYVHNQDDSEGEFTSVHHDIKPANLLVFPGYNSPYGFTIKLCDFGISNTKDTQASLGRFKEGSATYSAPERYLSDRIEYRAKITSDLFAAGALILDTAAWVTNGKAGREEFCSLRRREIQQKSPRMYERGHACFHTGDTLLPCVRDVRNTLRPTDTLTASIIAAVVNKVMTVNEDQRLPAGRLLSHLESIISDDRAPIITSTLGLIHRSSHSRLPSSNELDECRVDDSAGSMNRNRDQGRLSPLITTNLIRDGDLRVSPSRATPQDQRSPCGETSPGNPPLKQNLPHVSFEAIRMWRNTGKTSTLPGRDVAWKYLDGRDTILVFDNSETMQIHRADVLDKLFLLSSILKLGDPNKLEIMMTSDCKLAKRKDAKDVRNYVSERFAQGNHPGATHMETCLGKLFDRIKNHLPDKSPTSSLKRELYHKYISSKSPPVSVYFLTDGAWVDHHEPSDDETLKGKIWDLANEIDKRQLKRQFVSIQFIRFGEHNLGIQKLDELDDLLPGQRDFIDHKPINHPGGVWELLVGSIMSGVDSSPSRGASPR